MTPASLSGTSVFASCSGIGSGILTRLARKVGTQPHPARHCASNIPRNIPQNFFVRAIEPHLLPEIVRPNQLGVRECEADVPIKTGGKTGGKKLGHVPPSPAQTSAESANQR